MPKLLDARNALSLVVILVLVLSAFVQQSRARSCGNTFFSSLIQMIPCRASVAPFSPIQPSEACCNAIKTLGQPCLCVLVNGPPISGVDRNMALQLPDKCTANFQPCNEHSNFSQTSTFHFSFSQQVLNKQFI